MLDEAVLRRMVGGREVMRRQLEHLVEMAQLLDVDLYLLPDSIGAHAGVEGTFTVLDYPEDFAPDPGTAYVEDRLQGHYDERPTEVADYRDAHKRLRTQALDPQPTVEAISRVAKDM
ncbi:MAG: hypothetical protein JOZ47_14860 [Kutzneria sp.]|nr:hypothetical protein [Kutzneria sp.]